YNVTFTVTDAAGAAGSATAVITVTNRAPTASLQGGGLVSEGSPAAVSFAAPSDPSAADTAAGFRYAFALDAASLEAASHATSGTSPVCSFPFDDGESDHTVFGRIFDKDGGFSDSPVAVHVANVPPTATLSAPATVNEGSVFTVALTSPSDPSQADTAAGFRYAFAVDGASLAGATYANSGTAAAH